MSSKGSSYCTHPKAKSYTCEYLCAHDLCPVEGEVVPKSEPKAPKEPKTAKATKAAKAPKAKKEGKA